MSNNNDRLFSLYSSPEELLREATSTAAPVDEEFKKSLKLYFIARYFVAVHESRFGEIPIQVWNEYRNALDHFFRNLTDNGSDGHLAKMEGHLQRAVLDVLKLVTHRSNDNVDSTIKQIDNEASSLIDNGEFLPSIRRRHRLAVSLFEKAKTEDIRLGEDAKTNDSVLSLYLDATFSVDEISRELFSRDEDIHKAWLAYCRIHRKGEVGGLWHHVKAHGVWYLLVAVAGYLMNFIPPIFSWLSSVIG